MAVRVTRCSKMIDRRAVRCKEALVHPYRLADSVLTQSVHETMFFGQPQSDSTFSAALFPAEFKETRGVPRANGGQ